MNKFHTILSARRLELGFIAVGFLTLLLRFFFYSPESIPTGDSVWQLTMSVTLTAGKDHPTVYMASPLDSPNNRVISQTFVHPGLDIKRLIQRKNSAVREIVAVARDKGNLTLTGEYKIHVSQTRRWQKWFEREKSLTAEERTRYLQLPPELQLDDTVINDVLKKVRSKVQGQDLLVSEIFNYVNQQILTDRNASYTGVDKVLSRHRANDLGKANTMLVLCRASNVPARLVTGVAVRDMLNASEHYWIEVYMNGTWVPYDPYSGHAGELPADYVKLKEDSSQLAYLNDGTPLNVIIDMEQIPAPAGLMGTGQKRLIDIFDLARLPVSSQFLLSTLLLLPFGALITTFFRSIVGVQTYGTFKSTMLALAIIYADWITVTVVISSVTIIGTVGRAIMPEKMTRVPRLSIVMTIVAITMVLSVSVMDYFNLNPTATVVLLPIIVMTSLVDSVYRIADDHGIAVALYRLTWTWIVAIVCYMVFTMEELRELLIRFPEVHFFTLATILMCNSYSGKKLTTLPVFQLIREPVHKKPQSKHKKSDSEDI